MKTAHVAGHPSGAGTVLQLAVDALDLDHSLVLIEPALSMVPNGNVIVDTFIEELSVLQGWQFRPTEAAAIHQWVQGSSP